jgi:protease IV
MGRFFLKVFATIGFLVVLGLAIGLGFYLWTTLTGPKVPDNAILTLDLDGTLPDGPPDRSLAGLLAGKQTTLRDALGALERAGADPRVKGLLLAIGPGDYDLAQVQELRDAIIAFRAKGKTALAFADTFGEFGSGTVAYYLASSCDQIWLQPLGMVDLVGLRAEEPFLHGTLDKLGIVAHFEAREQYKTAMNFLTQTKMTEAHREEVTKILDSLSSQIVTGISGGRKLAPDRVKDLIDKGPFLAQEAVDDHLVDHLGYASDALDALKKSAAGEKTMRLDAYLDAVGPPHREGPVVALIYANGLMVRGKTKRGLYGGGLMGADDVVHAFRLAAADKSVRAILFRVDSPGGSATAAETIWAAVAAAQKAGKPVVVSMGSVAGSGGYYIAAGADKIVAEPATLTGSIGVVAGKILLNGALSKIGASVDSVQTSDNAALFSPFEDFTAQGRRDLDAALDQTYAGFKARVVDGRHMDPDQVESVAKGRVWTGEDAKAISLVDALGGYDTALALVKAQIGMAGAGGKVTLKVYPPPQNELHALLDRVLGRGDDDASLAHGLASLASLAQQIRLITAPPGALTMEPLEIR